MPIKKQKLGLCATCKYWVKSDEPLAPVKLGLCDKVWGLWKCTTWGKDPNIRAPILRDKFKNHLAFVTDGSDYRAELHTIPTFGCVQYEAKDEIKESPKLPEPEQVELTFIKKEPNKRKFNPSPQIDFGYMEYTIKSSY